MCDTRKLEELAKDISVSNDDMFKAWLEYVQNNSATDLQEIERIRLMMENLRPGVMTKAREWLANIHNDCCGPGAPSNP